MLVALLCGSIAAAVVWRIAENDAADRRRTTADAVITSLERAADDMVVTVSGSSSLVDADGRMRAGALQRYASDLADVGAARTFAWMIPAPDGAWVVETAVLSDDDATTVLRPGTTIPAGSDIADAASRARATGRPVLGRFDPGAPTGSSGADGRAAARLAVLKPVSRSSVAPGAAADPGDVVGVIASVGAPGALGRAISTDLPPEIRYAVSDGGDVVASSEVPPSGGVTRAVVVDGRRLAVHVQDDRPVNHDLSWFLLWISAVVVAAAGTVGLRSARYDEDRRRTNTLISRTAELAQHLARAATADEVATVIGDRLPPLLGADVATFAEIDRGRRTVRLHHRHGLDHDVVAGLDDLHLDDIPDIAAEVGAGHVVILRTPDDWRRSFPAGRAEPLLSWGASVGSILPLEVAGRGVVAVIGVVWRAVPDLDERMAATLDTVKELSEQTLGRAELTDRASTHASQLAVLAEQLAGADTVDDAIALVARMAHAPVGADDVTVALSDADDGTLRVHRASSDPGTPTSSDVVPLSDPGPLAGAARTGAPVLPAPRDRPTTPEAPSTDRGPDAERADAEPVAAVLPLRADGAVIGSIGFRWDHDVALDDDLVNDLTTVSEMTAQTLRRAQLVEQLRGSVVRNQAIAEFAQHITNVRTTSQLCSAVVEHAASGVGADVADIGLVDRPGTGATVRGAACTIPDFVSVDPTSTPSPPATECLRSGTPVVLRGGTELRRHYPPASFAALERAGIAQTAHLPLTGPDGSVLGVLGVGWRTRLEVSDTIWAKLRTLGELCSQTLQRVHLAEAEHRLVVSLQERVVQPVPRATRLAVAERYLPAAEQVGMGGDWFEGIPIDDERFAVVVGDIAGHGINAVADMVELRAIIGSSLRTSTPLGELYPQVTELLHRRGRRLTATSCTAVFDTSGSTVRYISAGHPPPVLGHPDGRVELLTDGRQPLLGVPSRPVVEGSAPFVDGSVVVLYTDGIVERRNEAIDESLARIEAALRDLLADRGSSGPDGRPDVERIADGLLRRCLDDRPTDDDVALVVIGRAGARC